MTVLTLLYVASSLSSNTHDQGYKGNVFAATHTKFVSTAHNHTAKDFFFFSDISPVSIHCFYSCFVVCPDGSFVCDNAVCVHESWECDGLDDCGDNSDEDDCAGLLSGI